MDILDKELGKIIKQKRKSMKMTQTELGKKVGVAVSTMSLYECGKRGMTISMFFDVCNVLGLEPNDIQKQLDHLI